MGLSRRELYQMFLKSPEWKKKASFVRVRACSHCERCGCLAEHCSAVHHKHYKGHSDNPDTKWPAGWDCHPMYLQLLCCDCHEFIHGRSCYDPLSPPSWADLEERVKKLGQ